MDETLPAFISDGEDALSFSVNILTIIGYMAVVIYTVSKNLYRLIVINGTVDLQHL